MKAVSSVHGKGTQAGEGLDSTFSKPAIATLYAEPGLGVTDEMNEVVRVQHQE
jgi:hypothetical protein